MLKEAGFGVKLEHDDKETTWEDHGYVKVLVDGKVVAEDDKVQHNRSYSQRSETLTGMFDAVKALAAAPETGGTKAA